MDWGTFAAGVVTLAIFSFLYKDNPFYRLAEHLLIGLSVGFTLVMLFNSVLMDLLFVPLFAKSEVDKVIPLLFGLTMFARFRRSWSSWSKPALALMIGAGAGASIPNMLDARILQQLAASVRQFAAIGAGAADWWAIVTAIISLVGVLTVMVYFFFTRPDREWINGISRLGVYFLMLFFGATFGYTVTSRLTLLIGRLEFLLGDVLGLL